MPTGLFPQLSTALPSWTDQKNSILIEKLLSRPPDAHVDANAEALITHPGLAEHNFASIRTQIYRLLSGKSLYVVLNSVRASL